MHGCKIGEQGASDKPDNIVRFWCNIPLKKEQTAKSRKRENRSASQGAQLFESDINGVRSLRPSFTCLIIFFFFNTGDHIAEKKQQAILKWRL